MRSCTDGLQTFYKLLTIISNISKISLRGKHKQMDMLIGWEWSSGQGRGHVRGGQSLWVTTSKKEDQIEGTWLPVRVFILPHTKFGE